MIFHWFHISINTFRETVKDESDVGQYSLRVFNPHGEARCSADLCYDTLDSRPKRPLGDQYTDFEEFRMSGAPVPLADRPIINLITDRYLTLSWKPSIPIGPRIPVTYEVIATVNISFLIGAVLNNSTCPL